MIGGTGRSGSNVLKNILGLAPGAAALPFETRFTVDPDGLLPAYRALRASPTPFEMHRILTRLERLLVRVARRSWLDRVAMRAENAARAAGLMQLNLRRYKEWELSAYFPGFEAAVKRLLRELETGRYAGIWPGRCGHWQRSENRIAVSATSDGLRRAFSTFLTENIGEFLALQGGAQFYIDDNTYNLQFSPELLELLPGAHLVHIVRDPRDVVASFLHQRWTPRNLPAAQNFYRAAMDNILAATERVAPARLTVVRLEDLAAEPESVLTKLCRETGLTLTPEMLAVDLSAANSGRWRTDISRDDHSALCEALAPYARKFGYDTD